MGSILNLIPPSFLIWIQLFKEKFLHGYRQASYSADGIDLILKTELAQEKNIFYVDVGANHPYWSSNSYIFYLMGGRGINIDATPGIMEIFSLARPRDINIEAAISTIKKKMTYLVFDFAAYNGFEGTFDQKRIKYLKVKKKIEIIPQKLSAILDKHLPKNQEISVLLVDTEGHDLEVLKSNNWSKYKPKYIVIEFFAKTLKTIYTDETYKYLRSNNYEVIAGTQTNLLFKRVK